MHVLEKARELSPGLYDTTETGHVVYGQGAYKTVGHVARGIVFLVNPVVDMEHPMLGGLTPCDHWISVSQLWLFGEYKGKVDKRGVKYRRNYELWRMPTLVQKQQQQHRDGNSLFTPEELPYVIPSSDVKTVTTPELALAGGFTALPDHSFDVHGLRLLKNTSVGYAIAAARYTGLRNVVIAGLQSLAGDPLAMRIFSNWLDDQQPDWVFSFGDNLLGLPVYRNPEVKQKQLRNPDKFTRGSVNHA